MSQSIKSIDISVIIDDNFSYLKTLFEGLSSQVSDLKNVSISVNWLCKNQYPEKKLRQLLESYDGIFYSLQINQFNYDQNPFQIHNISIEKSKGLYILILQSNVLLDVNCLNELIGAAEKDKDHVAAWEARLNSSDERFCCDPITLEATWKGYAPLMIKRMAFEKVKGFDIRLILGACADLSFRLQSVGLAIRYVPKAISYTYENKKLFKTTTIPIQKNHLTVDYNINDYRNYKDFFKGIIIQIYLLILAFVKIDRNSCNYNIADLMHFIHTFSKWRKNQNIKKIYDDWEVKCDSLRYSKAYKEFGNDDRFISKKKLRKFPLVSVLIRTIGRRMLIYQALETVANQTYPNIEIIVVEDGSSFLANIKEKFSKTNVLYFSTEKRLGRSHSGNLALSKARGQYFIFLDEDDLFFPTHIERLVTRLIETQKKIIYSYALEIQTEIDPISNTIIQQSRANCNNNLPFSFLRLLDHNYIPINSVLFHREIYETCGGFDTELDEMEDWDLLVRFCLKYRPFEFLPIVTALYRIPKDKQTQLERRKRLVKWWQKARKKHANIEINMSVGELIHLYGGSDLPNSLESVLCRRFPSWKFIIHTLARLSRNLKLTSTYN